MEHSNQYQAGFLLKCNGDHITEEENGLTALKGDVLQVVGSKTPKYPFIYCSISSWNERAGNEGYINPSYLEPVEIQASNEQPKESNDYEEPVGVIGAVYEVKFEYLPTKSDELRLHLGDKITSLETPEGGWWRGRKEDGSIGWFPATLVVLYSRLSSDPIWPTGVACGLPGEFVSGDVSKSDPEENTTTIQESSSPSASKERNKVGSFFSKLVKKSSRTRSVSGPVNSDSGMHSKGRRTSEIIATTEPLSLDQVKEDFENYRNLISSNGTIGPIPSKKVTGNDEKSSSTRQLLKVESELENDSSSKNVLDDSASLISTASSIIKSPLSVQTTLDRKKTLLDPESPTTAVSLKTPSPVEKAKFSHTSLQILPDSWTELLEPKKLSALSEKEKNRQNAIWELLKTENDYVRDLKIIVNDFRYTMLNKKILSQKHAEKIFNNVSNLLQINSEFLDLLLAKIKPHIGADCIGDVFLKMSDKFLAYTLYCGNQTTSNQKLQQLIKSNKDFRVFLEDSYKSNVTRGLDLSSFLLKPIQRICKYPLLIKEILKHTEPNSVDQLQLSDALEKIQATITIVNQSGKLGGDGTRTIYQIQEKFTENLNFATPNRHLVREDDLFLIVGQSKKPRKVFLFNDLLIIARNDWRDKYHLIEKANLRDCRVCDVQIDNSAKIQAWFFEIEIGQQTGSSDLLTADNKYIFICSSIEIKKGWLDSYKSLTQLKVRNKHLPSVNSTLNISAIDLSDDEDELVKKVSKKDLEAQVKALQAELDSTKNELGTAKELSTSLETERDSLNLRLKDHQNTINQYETQEKELKSKNHALVEESKNLGKQYQIKLDENNSEIQKIRKQNSELIYSNETKQATINSLTFEISKLKSDHKRISEEVAGLQVKLKDAKKALEEQATKSTRSYNDLLLEKDQIKLNLTASLERERKANERLLNITNEHSKCANDLSVVKQELGRKIQLMGSDMENTKLTSEQKMREELKIRDIQINDLKLKLETKDISIKSLDEKNENLVSNNNYLQSELTKSTDLIKTKDYGIQILEATVSSLNSEIDFLSSKENEHKSIIAALKTNLDLAKTESIVSHTKIEELNYINSTYLERISHLQSELDKNNELMDKMQSEFDLFNIKLLKTADLDKQVELLSNENDELLSKIRVLEESVAFEKAGFDLKGFIPKNNEEESIKINLKAVETYQLESLEKLDYLDKSLALLQNQLEQKTFQQVQRIYDSLKEISSNYHEILIKEISKASESLSQKVIDAEREKSELKIVLEKENSLQKLEFQEIKKDLQVSCEALIKERDEYKRKFTVLQEKMKLSKDSNTQLKKLFKEKCELCNELLQKLETSQSENSNAISIREEVMKKLADIEDEKLQLSRSIDHLQSKQNDFIEAIRIRDKDKENLFTRLSDIFEVYIDSYKTIEQYTWNIVDQKKGLDTILNTKNTKIRELELLCKTNLEHTKVSSEIIKDVQQYCKGQISKLKEDYEFRLNQSAVEKQNLQEILEATIRSLHNDIRELNEKIRKNEFDNNYKLSDSKEKMAYEIRSLRENIENKDSRLIQLSNELTRTREIVKQLHDEKQDEIVQKNNAVTAIKYLSSELESAKSKISGLLQIIENYQMDLNSLEQFNHENDFQVEYNWPKAAKDPKTPIKTSGIGLFSKDQC